MNKKNILLLGGSGFLGTYIQNLPTPHKIIAPTHNKFVLNEKSNFKKFLDTNKINAVIYTAGVTKIDNAQKEPDTAYLLNAEVPKQLATLTAGLQIPMVYISTDAVFDGHDKQYIFTEKDKPQTKSVYGKTKLIGENNVLEASNKHTVIRLISLFGINHQKVNFVSRFITSLQNGEKYYGITNQIQNPTYIETAAASVLYSLDNNLSGIFHVGSLNAISNYDFLTLIGNKFKLNLTLLEKISYEKLMGDKTAFRKKDTILVSDKFDKITNGTILRNLEESINMLYKAMR